MAVYNKPPLTYTEQIELLKNRGLQFADENKAIQRLANISYYRLSAYMLPFKKNVAGNIVDDFRYGSSWEDVYQLYIFDRKLRLFIFDAIERIEVAVRDQIVYQLSHKYGSHWQDIQSIFKPANTITRRDGSVRTFDAYNEIQNHIKEQLNNNQAEVFIQHYKDTYASPENPPSWMCVEIMYFNHLSKICTSLKNRSDVTGIANHFGLPPEKFCSWLHTINYVRNLCAHHSRLWNRDLKIVPERLDFSRSKVWISNPNSVQRSKIYHFLCMLNYMLQSVNPSSTFTSRLKALLNKYPKVSKSAMGFPQNWENEDMWRNCLL